MRRLGRYIFNGLTVLSLLICMATIVIWIRGHWYDDYAYGGRNEHLWVVRLESGAVTSTLEGGRAWKQNWYQFGSSTVERRFAPTWEFMYIRPDSSATDVKWQLSGFSFYSVHWVNEDGKVIQFREFTLSYWLIVLLTLILPASRIRFRKRHRPGLCPKCRYDLRATPERCPECGTVVAGAGRP